MLEIFFWVLLAILIYTFFGYPVICYLLGKVKSLPVQRDDNYLPNVTVIVSAYNEEKLIGDKIDNTLKLDYPQDKLNVIIASDGSNDRTTDIIKEKISAGAPVILLDSQINRGKTTVQNEAVLNARGEVVVFSDANSMYEKDAIRKIVRNFSDPAVGCVCGELIYMEGDSAAGQGEGFYWRYEQFLKKAESNLGNVLGANGAIYAVRKDFYVPLSEEIISDFVEPLKIIESGYRAVYEEEAVACEKITTDYNSEWRRKIRIISRSYHGLLAVKNLLNPFKHGLLALGLFSHKLLRWYAGFFLILIFFLNICLAYHQGSLFVFLLFFQLFFYGLAAVGLVSKRKWKPFMMPAYFCMVNYASLLALFKYYSGHRYISWKPVR